MKTLNVELGKRSYPIYIGAGLLNEPANIRKHIRGKQVFIVTNDKVGPLYLDRLLGLLADYDCKTIQLKDGEQYKNLDSLSEIITALLENRLNRDVTLIALGGGVVGDITGFVAACYQRGVNFIQVPTTLLAQVDSSVGGKTAVNHRLGKNMIGAFHQPVAVIADIEVLNTLESRELGAGLAEVIKYGLIRDSAFYGWLQENIQALLNLETDALVRAIQTSCQNKADIVAADEREGGIRAILNLGHTFGHAIETAQNYTGLLHGEAVALGMLMAARLSSQIYTVSKDDCESLRSLLETAGLPVQLPAGVSAETMLQHMAVDKKNREGKITLILLEEVGKAVIRNDIDRDQIIETINAFA